MDNFMDKLAQRFNAQEMIKANSQAEAKELERLRQQTEMYDGYLKEMRSLNLKNVEVAEQITQMAGQIQKLTDQAVEKIAGMQEAAGKEQVQAMIEKLGQLQDDIVAAKQQAEAERKEILDSAKKDICDIAAEAAEKIVYKDSKEAYDGFLDGIDGYDGQNN